MFEIKTHAFAVRYHFRWVMIREPVLILNEDVRGVGFVDDRRWCHRGMFSAVKESIGGVSLAGRTWRPLRLRGRR